MSAQPKDVCMLEHWSKQKYLKLKLAGSCMSLSDFQFTYPGQQNGLSPSLDKSFFFGLKKHVPFGFVPNPNLRSKHEITAKFLKLRTPFEA